MNNLPIPTPDPLGIPGPIFLFQLLASLTLFLHFTASNLTLGGALLGALAKGRGHGSGDALSKWVFKLLPALVAATITTAIPPLLFLQVLYGPFFYSTTVLMAVPWFAVLFLMAGGYVVAYLLNFRWEALSKRALPLGLLISILFALVALVMTSMTLLSLHPERWTALYGNPHLGLKWDLCVPGLTARYLHFLLASPAVAGAFLGLVGQIWMKSGRAEGEWTFKYGTSWFLGVTVLQFGVGTWFLLSHPKEIWMSVMGGDLGATGAFVLSMVAILSAMAHYLAALMKGKSVGLAWGGFASLLVTVFSMTAVRLHFRNYQLAPYMTQGFGDVHPQWGLITVFLLLLVAGLGTVGWMLAKVFGEPKAA